MARRDPDHTLEDALHAQGHTLLAGVDEVGRGAWAGPLCIGALVPGPRPAPAGIRDSKLLAPARRAQLLPVVQDWATAWAVGLATVTEIDTYGMAACLRLAARRALATLPVEPDAVILDGPHDYIGAPWNVTARPKADQDCVAVAAASIIAKEHRDALLRDLATAHPQYHLDVNAGYPSPAHRAALAEHGPQPGLHRLSWKYVDDLPGFSHLRLPAPDGTATPPAD
jgi:ribonuclease HII